MLRLLKLIVVLVAISHCSPSFSSCPTEVRVGLPDFPVPPLLYGTTTLDETPGDIVVWTRNAANTGNCKPKVSIRRLPVKRLQAEMGANKIDVAPGLSLAAEHLTELVFPMRGKAVDTQLSIIRDRLSLYVLAADTTTKWDGQNLNLPTPRIGLSAGSAAGQLEATKKGWYIDVARNPLGNLTKLKAHRIDAILESEMLFDTYLATAPGMKGDIRRLEPAVATVDRYAPVSEHFFQAYPEYVRLFWKNMRQQAGIKKK